MELLTIGYIFAILMIVQVIVVVLTAGVVKSRWDTINEDETLGLNLEVV